MKKIQKINEWHHEMIAYYIRKIKQNYNYKQNTRK